jgi:hypothetical protein
LPPGTIFHYLRRVRFSRSGIPAPGPEASRLLLALLRELREKHGLRLIDLAKKLD